VCLDVNANSVVLMVIWRITVVVSAVGIELNAIGLGSLSGSSSQASMNIEVADEGRFATLAA